MTTKRKRNERKVPRKTTPRKTEQAIARTPSRFDEPSRDAATSVTVKDEVEALRYFALIDDRLADAWKRDVVMHEGPITIHRVTGYFFDATHYAYVDRRLFWYLKRDSSDPLGAKWEGFLKVAGDAPQGTTVSYVGRDIMVKKCSPHLTEGGAVPAESGKKKESL
jgi:hypothetical protein